MSINRMNHAGIADTLTFTSFNVTRDGCPDKGKIGQTTIAKTRIFKFERVYFNIFFLFESCGAHTAHVEQGDTKPASR